MTDDFHWMSPEWTLGACETGAGISTRMSYDPKLEDERNILWGMAGDKRDGDDGTWWEYKKTSITDNVGILRMQNV